MKLVNRRAECGMLDRLVEAVCAGESRALVLSGEPGVGKTALLPYLIGQAAQCQLVQIAGVESEMELALPAATSCARRCWLVWRICRSGRAMLCGSCSVGVVFAARVPTSDLAGLSQLPLAGLGAADARAAGC